MDEERFWSLIEAAWQSVGGKAKARQKLAQGELSEENAEGLADQLEDVVPALEASLDELTADELLAFDRILERKLHDIDREEIQAHTDGSDDGFLYARGFIVAVGRQYYEAVNARPSVAMSDLWCEEMCYLSWHAYEKKYGKMPPSGISRESCNNAAGWPGLK